MHCLTATDHLSFNTPAVPVLCTLTSRRCRLELDTGCRAGDSGPDSKAALIPEIPEIPPQVRPQWSRPGDASSWDKGIAEADILVVEEQVRASS